MQMKVTDSGVAVIAIYERWQELVKMKGAMPKNDKEWWDLVDLLDPHEFEIIMEYAMQSKFIRAPERLWAQNKLEQRPFRLRNKNDKWSNSNNNHKLWKILLNSCEQIKIKIEQEE